MCVGVCVEGALSHGCGGVAEEPVRPAALDWLCVRGERPHYQLHPAVYLCAVAHQQTAVPQDQHQTLLLAMEP